MRLRVRVRNDDLIRIRVNDEIPVVRHHDNLSPCFSLHERWDQFVEHRLRVQVLLRLVDMGLSRSLLNFG